VTRAFAALALCALAFALARPAHAGPNPGPSPGLGKSELAGVGFDQRLGESVPLDAAFRDETGQSVTLSRYFSDRPVVLALVYNECPMLCNLVLHGLVGSLRAISTDVGKDFDVVVVSFDPKDKPDVARKKKDMYVARYKRPTGASGFHFLTGDSGSIQRLTRAVGFRYEYDAKLGQYAHASGIVVLTKSGVISRYLFGSEFSPKDLGFSLAEASNGKVGSLATRLLLLCYRYDPATGSYGARIMGAVRLGGVLTLLALLIFMGRSLYRERRKRGHSAPLKGGAS
jgi:protein SCO1